MPQYSLFEVSWEVCNKVGGIYTVVSTKARTIVERLGDDYVAIGPWQLGDTERDVPFDEEPGHQAFVEACRELGLPVRVGRWRIPGRPRTLLVEFSKLYPQKDEILARLWEEYRVDSLHGTWDYVEPVLFGHAAGQVIEIYREHYPAPQQHRAVVQAHEWMTGSALLYVKTHLPSCGTVFTTHATMLGRALSSLGHSPEDGIGSKTPAELASEHGVVAKHSIEGVVAREADVFTTVSEITAREAKLLHGRAPEPILPNGIDLGVIDELAGPSDAAATRARLLELVNPFLCEDVSEAAFLAISGRYEFHNKGIDLLLDALAELAGRPGRQIVLFVLVPAGNSGVASLVRQCLEDPAARLAGPAGISTHNLFDAEHDPVQQHCKQLGLANAPGARVKVVQIPIYLSRSDGFLNLPYEAVLRAMDLTCFPSYYEPWGYTPQESLALGVPTITSDFAGFGRWAQSRDLGPDDGIVVLPRFRREYGPIVAELADELDRRVREGWNSARLAETCRKSAALTSWSEAMIEHYYAAFARALDSVQGRLERGVPQTRRLKRPVSVQSVPEGSRPRLFAFDVSATLPASLTALLTIARNFAWCWDPEGPELFSELSPRSWAAARHNPVTCLQRVYPEDLAARAADGAYLAKLERVRARLATYLASAPAEDELGGYASDRPIAYFCAEYGLHESLPIYSGGLGVLAGDHLKSASDLGLPLVAVGLFYRMGYMSQRLSLAGEQIALDVENDGARLALEAVRDAEGKPLELKLPLPGRELALRAWLASVGRVRLYLLDANVPANSAADRDITRNLYGGSSETRLLQEIVLGRAGVRLLRELGIQPAVWHINEGHAAFMTLERTSQLARREGLTFEEARELVRATTLFTTHTPVPAGHDRFDEDLLRRYFSDVSEWLGVPWESFYALGHAPEDASSFNMTYLALNFAAWVNGVSELHGVASRKLLHAFWPGLLESEVPVRSITNGVHLATWTNPELLRTLGGGAQASLAVRAGRAFAEAAAKVSPAELWRVKRAAKAALLALVRERSTASFLERHDSPTRLQEIVDSLDPEALVIGFARRFAPYKRAHLLFQDPARLSSILRAKQRPVLLLIAGKAHPRDGSGQEILKSIVELSRKPELVGRIVFLEDYDMDVARALVQGVDVWLNTPTRMLEASGTSGMKAAANGALNLSIGDGWWPEGFDGGNGWRIGDERAYDDQKLQDQLDAATLYRLLEEEVVPEYFARGTDGLPAAWLARVVASLTTIPAVFNTDRMVGEYRDRAYKLLGRRGAELERDRRAPLREQARERARVRRGFADLRIAAVEMADLAGLAMGDSIDVQAEIDLGGLKTEDVQVELVLGVPRGERQLERLQVVALAPEPSGNGALVRYRCSRPIDRSGSFAYGLRVRPASAAEPGDSLGDLVRWA